MFKNLSIRGFPSSCRSVAAALAALCLASLTSVGSALAADTQLVVQWLTSGPLAFNPQEAFKIEDQLEKSSEDLYFVDGNDIGGETLNIFIFADDSSVEASIAKIVALYEKGLLPQGMRIGVANYKDQERTDWTYKAVYPPELKTFEISY